MKTLLFILVLMAPAAQGQTNLPVTQTVTTNETSPVAATNAPPVERLATDILSDKGWFDLKNRTVIYSGNVRVSDPQMKLTCEILTVRVPTNGGRVDTLVAERSVKIEAADQKGKPVHVTCDKALYEYKVSGSATNEIITLTGHVFVESAAFTGTGEPLIWDRVNGTISGANIAMSIPMEKKSPTNAPPANLGNKL